MSENTTLIPRQGDVHSVATGHLSSYLVPAVLCTLFGFMPLGLAAVVYAGRVKTLLAYGDAEAAKRAATTAKRLCWASVAMTLLFLLIIVVGASGYSSGANGS